MCCLAGTLLRAEGVSLNVGLSLHHDLVMGIVEAEPTFPSYMAASKGLYLSEPQLSVCRAGTTTLLGHQDVVSELARQWMSMKTPPPYTC